MTRVVGRLADQLLSVVAPRVAAHAAYQTRCLRCYREDEGVLYGRDCIRGVCEPWGVIRHGCGACRP